MPTSIHKILLRTQKPSQLWMALLGCLIGFYLMMASIQNYINIQQIFDNPDQAIGSQYLVINKKVSLLNSLSIKKSVFSASDISEIKNLPSVEKLSAFVPNQFEAQAYLQLSSQASNEVELKTDLFLESVQDSFIDAQSADWKWKENDNEVPVILPSDFINLYNFTYAPARGFPQISKGTTSLFGFKILIGPSGNQIAYKGKIIGFSDRITSMLVPMSFMEFANRHYSNFKEPTYDIFRLIIKVHPSELGNFNQYLLENGLETNNELLKSAKLSSLLQLTLLLVFLLGMLMIANAFSGFILYIQLTIARSEYELETLLRLGYSHRKLIKAYAVGILLLLLLINIATFGLVFVTQKKLAIYIQRFGFDITQQVHKYVVMSGLIVILILFVIFTFSVRSQLMKLAFPKKI